MEIKGVEKMELMKVEMKRKRKERGEKEMNIKELIKRVKEEEGGIKIDMNMMKRKIKVGL